MIDKLIQFSVKNKLVIGLMMVVWIGWGLYSMKNLNVDAVPDITNNQVQVVTVSPALAPEEVEQFITYPIEQSVANLQGLKEIRSISRYGLSVVTIVFEDNFNTYLARQLVSEALSTVDIPEQYGKPELMPITTGLGEIYQYTLEVDPEYKDYYDLTDLRTIQDWIIKRQLSGTKGIVEISSFGGYVKQYEVAVDPQSLWALNITIDEIVTALERNNQNTGGSYIQQGPYAQYIRAEGLVKNKEEIENIVVTTRNGVPIHINDVAEVRIGHPTRYGAMTKDGKGETVGGITLMLKGGNANKVIKNVKQRINQIEKNLPTGVHIKPYYDRTELVDRVITTITENLTIAALIVVFVLVLLLGSLRAGFIASSVIPLSLLFAFGLMDVFNVSASVMSLGAIDFGLIVDGSVIILEAIMLALHTKYEGQTVTQKQLDAEVIKSSGKVGKSAAFGVLIILIVYLPLLALQGIEGKMFKPLALTITFALIGGLILSLTYIPMMTSLFLGKKMKKNFSDKIVDRFQKIGMPGLRFGMTHKKFVLGLVIALFALSAYTFSRMGAEFIPSLEEGDLAMQITLPPGSSLNESIKISTQAEKILLEKFPEVKSVVSKIGTAEVPTDPMAIEDADVMILMKPKSEWTTAKDRFEMANKMKKELSVITGATFDFTQPIQLRFNELLTGAKSDIVIKIYGEDLDTLYKKANEIARLIEGTPGAADIKVEQVAGLPQVIFKYNRQKLAEYGLSVADLNNIIKSSLAGANAGIVFEGERRFDLVVRMKKEYRNNLDNIKNLFVRTPSGTMVALDELVTIEYKEGPMQISRDDTHRRITIGINVRNRDIKSLVDEISQKVDANIKLPPGYYITYGGQFENLQNATKRLMMVLPIALALIFILLYFAFGSMKQAIIIYSIIPLSVIGGVFSLWIRGLPFSISAGVGFIALFGVSVLNGIVLMNEFNKLKAEGIKDINERINIGVFNTIRPVALTTLVAALGFIPMAVSNQAGAEVQRPLATVVIGGVLIAATLALIVVPILYYYAYRNEDKPKKNGKNGKNGSQMKTLAIIALFLAMPIFANAQTKDTIYIGTEQAKDLVLKRNPTHKNALLAEKQAKLRKQANFDLGATEVSYEYGQINGAPMDYNFSAAQNLGNIPQKIAQSSMLNKEIELMQQKTKLTEKELKFQVCGIFNTYIYWNKAADMYKEFLDLYKKAVEIAKLKVESGEASSTELIIMTEKYSQLKWQYNQAVLNEQKSLKDFNTLLFADTVVYVPNRDELRCDLHAKLYDSTALMKHPKILIEKTSLDIKQKEIAVAKTGFFPEISVGYFNQQIEGIQGFQGVNVTLSVPLWFAPKAKETKIAKLDYQIQQNQLQYAELDFYNQYMQLVDEYLQTKEKLDYYENTGLQLARQLLNNATNLYESGEIEYIEYLQNMSEAISIIQEYNSTLYYYNSIIRNINYMSFNQ